MKKIYFGLAALALSLAMITGCSSPNSEGPGGTIPPVTGFQSPLYSYASVDSTVTISIYEEYNQYFAFASVYDSQSNKIIEVTSNLLDVNGSEFNGSIASIEDADNPSQSLISPDGHIKITVSETMADMELSDLPSPFDGFNKSYNSIPVYSF